MLNGDAHYSTLRMSRRISRRCLVFNDYTMHMITDDEPSYHARALYRLLSARPYRILYVGLNHALLDYLQACLNECWIVRAPAACVARPFIRELHYSLLLFDNVLMDASERELARFTRSLPQRQSTPIIIVEDTREVDALMRAIRHKLR